MKNIIFSAIFLLVSNAVTGQLKEYNEAAIFLDEKGAIERFKYFEADSLKLPHGNYEWKQQIKTDSNNIWKLSLINAEFENGIPHGFFKWISYDVEVLVSHFNAEIIQSRPVGYQMLVTGEYDNGKIVGNWQFVRLPYGQLKDTLFQLNYYSNNSFWNFQDQLSSFSGTTKAGYFDSNWDWLIYDSLKIESEFTDGILTDISLNNQLVGDEETLNYVAYALEATDMQIKTAPEISYVWTNGFDTQDSVYHTQEIYSSFLKEKLSHFDHLFSIVNSNKQTFQIPQIKGTKRFFYELPEKHANKLVGNLSSFQNLDSTLKDQISYPIFHLKRSNRPELDEIINQTERILDTTSYFSALAETFLKIETRFSSVRYLPELPNSNAATHKAYSTDLNLMLELNLFKLRDLSEKLDAFQFKLREESNIEELETEWSELHNEIEKMYQPNENSGLAFSLYNKFVNNKFQTHINEYNKLISLNQKKEFLKNTIEYTQWARNFFKNRDFQFLLDAREDFNESYIRYLLNPYTGKYDIPEIRKRRFLNKVQTEFWPWVIRSVEVSNDKDQLIEELELANKYRLAILLISPDSGKDLDRFVKSLRREKDMGVFAEKLTNYVDVLEENLNEN